MALTILDQNQWTQVQNIIQTTFLERKVPFNQEMILEVIQEKLLSSGFSKEVMECSYFGILFLNTLAQFVDCGILYLMEPEPFYFPIDYIIFRDYDTKFSELLYFSKDESQQPVYINVDTSKNVSNIRNRDFLLTGGFTENHELLCPDISFEEIQDLYHAFRDEGVSKEEAINHILNYYQAFHLSHVDFFQNAMVIRGKAKKDKLTKILKNDN